MSSVKVKSFKRPVVQLSSDFKLKRAERVSDSFNTIAKRMSIVVEGIDTPFVTNMWMSMILYSVDNGISQGSVCTFVVDLGSERIGSFFMKS